MLRHQTWLTGNKRKSILSHAIIHPSHANFCSQWQRTFNVCGSASSLELVPVMIEYPLSICLQPNESWMEKWKEVGFDFRLWWSFCVGLFGKETWEQLTRNISSADILVPAIRRNDFKYILWSECLFDLQFLFQSFFVFPPTNEWFLIPAFTRRFRKIEKKMKLEENWIELKHLEGRFDADLLSSTRAARRWNKSNTIESYFPSKTVLFDFPVAQFNLPLVFYRELENCLTMRYRWKQKSCLYPLTCLKQCQIVMTFTTLNIFKFTNFL